MSPPRCGSLAVPTALVTAVSQAFEQAFDMLRSRGTMSLVGLRRQDVAVHLPHRPKAHHRTWFNRRNARTWKRH